MPLGCFSHWVALSLSLFSLANSDYLSSNQTWNLFSNVQIPVNFPRYQVAIYPGATIHYQLFTSCIQLHNCCISLCPGFLSTIKHIMDQDNLRLLFRMSYLSYAILGQISPYFKPFPHILAIFIITSGVGGTFNFYLGSQGYNPSVSYLRHFCVFSLIYDIFQILQRVRFPLPRIYQNLNPELT